MSALLQSTSLHQSLRHVSELDAITTIGRYSFAAVDAASGLESLANVALRLKGMHGVEVTVDAGGRLEAFERHASRTPGREDRPSD
jgi:hypothetical protein